MNIYSKQNIFSIFFLFISFFAVAQQELEIWEIQGSTNNSPYDGLFVTTMNNIVTAVGDDRFFIQTPPERSDNNSNTSDGLLVYTGSFPNLNIGDIVTVTGYIDEYNWVTEFSSSGLSVVKESTTTDIPDPIQLDENFPSTSNSTIQDLEKIEGMYAEVTNGIFTGPIEDGIAYFTNQPIRSFREAGIEYPGINGQPEWDGNPEVMLFEPELLNGGITPIISAGMRFTATGVISGNYSDYYFFPTNYSLSGTIPQRAVRDKTTKEATIGSINQFVFDEDDFGFDKRLNKMTNYIIQQLKTPDILAVQEVNDFESLQLLADAINAKAIDTDYKAFLEQGNNGSFINTGFLVRNSVQNIQVTQLGKTQNLSIGGKLHDRPPLLLEGEFTTNPPTPIQVLNLHLRSLNGIEGSNATFVRTKRHEQAIAVANMVRSLRDENLVVVGDFNAYEFSDGYVDVVNQISGNLSLGAIFEVTDIVNPPLTNHSALLPTDERYSYVYRGNAQILDHCLTNDLEDMLVSDFQYARGNSDAPDSYKYDDSNNLRVSDHDGFALFLELNDTLNYNFTPISQNSIQYPNPFSRGDYITIGLLQQELVQFQLYASDGRLILDSEVRLEMGFSEIPLHFFALSSGIYVLKITGTTINLTEKLFIIE